MGVPVPQYLFCSINCFDQSRFCQAQLALISKQKAQIPDEAQGVFVLVPERFPGPDGRGLEERLSLVKLALGSQ